MEEFLRLQRASVEEQIRAVSRQNGVPAKQQPLVASHDYITPILPLLAPAPLSFSDCPRLRASEINELVGDAAQQQSLPAGLIRAVMKQESGFKPCAVSVKGAEGLMQLMPITAEEFHVTDPFDPRQNVEAGAALLKQLFVKYGGELKLVLGAYNAGQARVDTANGVPNLSETRNYVSSILRSLGIEDHKSEDTFSVQAPTSSFGGFDAVGATEPLNSSGIEELNLMPGRSLEPSALFPIFEY